MRDFNRGGGFKRSFGGGSRFGGNNPFGGGKGFGGRDGSRPVMHKATCSECGANCEVPFRPTGDRPVFCSDCFKKQNDGGGRPNKFGGERRERSRFENKQAYDAICAKCGKGCQVPFRPTGDRPVFCSDCFKKDGSASKDSGGIMEQIKMLNAKIDKLLEILTLNASVEKKEKPAVKKEVIAEEVVKGKNKIKPALKKVLAKKKK